MSLTLAEWLALPPGFPDPRLDVAALRWALAAAVVAAVALTARWHWRGAATGGLAVFLVATGFWTATFARPHGLFLEAGTTAWSAQVAVAAASGRPGESFVSGERSGLPVWSAVAARAGTPQLLVALPTLLPLLVPVWIAAWLLALAGRGHGWLAAALFLGFATGEPDTLRVGGLLGGLWRHRDAGLLLAGAVPVALVAARLVRPGRLAAAAAGVVVVAATGVLRDPAGATGLADCALLVTLDQGPWLALAAWGAWRGASPAALGLVGGGAVATLLAPLGVTNVWLAAACYRVGLLLASAGAVEALADTLAAWWPGRIVERVGARRLGAATLVAVCVPGSFLFRWDPRLVDVTAEESIHQPLSPNVRAAMTWIRDNTEPDAVVVAGERWAPWVAALAQRRVLRAPGLVAPDDDSRRRRAEKQVLSGRNPGNLSRRYGLGYVLVAPGDFRVWDVAWPTDLDGRPGLRRVHADHAGFHVYRILPVEPGATP